MRLKSALFVFTALCAALTLSSQANASLILKLLSFFPSTLPNEPMSDASASFAANLENTGATGSVYSGTAKAFAEAKILPAGFARADARVDWTAKFKVLSDSDDDELEEGKISVSASVHGLLKATGFGVAGAVSTYNTHISINGNDFFNEADFIAAPFLASLTKAVSKNSSNGDFLRVTENQDITVVGDLKAISTALGGGSSTSKTDFGKSLHFSIFVTKIPEPSSISLILASVIFLLGGTAIQSSKRKRP